MPPRLPALHAPRSFVYRPAPCSRLQRRTLSLSSKRLVTADEKPLPEKTQPGPGPNQDQLPHVSEEAAATGKITGERGPEIEEQGTPVQEVLERDKETMEKAPQVIQDESQKSSPSGTRSFSTWARRRQADVTSYLNNLSETDYAALAHRDSQGVRQAPVKPDQQAQVSRDDETLFGLPSLPLPQNFHLKYRYDEIVEQVTNLIMQDGKKSVAQRVCQSVSLQPLQFSDCVKRG